MNSEDWMSTVLFAILILLLLLMGAINVAVIIDCRDRGGEVRGSFNAECHGGRPRHERSVGGGAAPVDGDVK